jgi:hypothetical protein
MLTIAADPRHLSARIGITAVLHSWGSALRFFEVSGCMAGIRRDVRRRIVARQE